MLRNKNINVATYRTLVTGIIEMFCKDVCFYSLQGCETLQCYTCKEILPGNDLNHEH